MTSIAEEFKIERRRKKRMVEFERELKCDQNHRHPKLKKKEPRASKKEEQEITIKLHNKRKVERIRRKGSSSK